MTESHDDPEPTISAYPDDLVAAVTAAQQRLCIQEVPAALDIRMKAASEARDAGVREWHLAGNREARPLETPYLRIRAASVERAGVKKASGRSRSQKKQ